MIIGLTGTLSSGKGSVVNILMKKGFKHFSVREFLMKELIRRGVEINRTSLVDLGNELRQKFSPSYIVEELYKEASQIGGDCVIESLRAIGEVEKLREENDFFLVAIDAQAQTRYERAFARASETDKIRFEEFLHNEQREMNNSDPTKQNLQGCISMADFVVENNGSVEELETKVEAILAKIKSPKKEEKIGKREDYISWDEYFMGVSLISGKRSKDPNTQVGACIVDKHKKIVGVGYNGFPKGCSDDIFPWSREGNFLETKYPYVVHAELNAILNSIQNLAECTMYVALFPCNECAKAIIQSGIKRLVYLEDKYAGTDSVLGAKKMFDSAGVTYEKLTTDKKEIVLGF